MIRCTVDMALERFVAIVSDASKEQYHLMRGDSVGFLLMMTGLENR